MMRLARSVEARQAIRLGLSVLFVAAVVAGYWLYHQVRPTAARLLRLRQYWANPEAYAEWNLHAGQRCGSAPFVFPTDGYLGFFRGDSFRPGVRHQGLDIFGPTGPDGLGQTPVVAAYAGYLTRQLDWRASVIIRIPSDPLQPGRQIWIYYTHMADAEGNPFIAAAFPPGTNEHFVSTGTFLGYQGNYSADPDNPVAMHLHFSIVLDDDQGHFRNELEIANTLDPTPYLGIEADARRIGDRIATCPADSGQGLP